eukprot:TRINITY_DN1054_c0_g1_i1.p1 TRINITY_DN1054_c0_g1~~TRINITY_DN1054_c0_g1_i1.p1  ORF type:complete len:239 (-),score=38.81 TRINITY_DN1054_c0_g1_i1:768-1484(-)
MKDCDGVGGSGSGSGSGSGVGGVHSIKEEGGEVGVSDFSGLFNSKFQGSMYLMIKSLFPDREWLPWKFSKLPNLFWDDVNNQIWYIKWLSNILNIREDEDAVVVVVSSAAVGAAEISKLDKWYSITPQIIGRHYGKGLIKKDRSLYHILKVVYPKHNWYPWLFKKIPNKFWDNKINRDHFIDYLEKSLSITPHNMVQEWRKVKIIKIYKMGGRSLLKPYYNDSLLLFLKRMRIEFSRY